MYEINKKYIKWSYFLLNMCYSAKMGRKDYTKTVEKILRMVLY